MANSSQQNLPPGVMKKIEQTIEKRSSTSSASPASSPTVSAESTVVTTDTLSAAKSVQQSSEFQTSRQTTQHLAELQYQDSFGQDGRIIWETAGGKVLYHQLADGQYLLSFRFGAMTFLGIFMALYIGLILFIFLKHKVFIKKSPTADRPEPPAGPIHRVQHIQLD
jgi:hypothetical protein